MKYSWHILTLLLAIAVALLSIFTLTNSAENQGELSQTQPPAMSSQEAALENIMTRSSVRSYTSQSVSSEHVEIMLKAGMAAPTAYNRQPWEFYVISDRDVIKEFASASPNAQMALDAPLAIVVCGDLIDEQNREIRYWIQDCSAATQNIMLSANAIGLGSVWCGIYPNDEREANVREILNIPDNLVPLNVIIIGHPDSEPNIKDKWKPERVHYVR